MQNCVTKDHTSKKHEENHCCDEDMNNQLQKALLKYSNNHLYLAEGDRNSIILKSRFEKEAIEELFDGLVFQFRAMDENTEPVLLALAKTNPRQLVYNNELLPSGFLKKDIVYSVQYSAEDDRFHILNIGSTVDKPKIVFNTIEEEILPKYYVTTASDWTSFYHKEIKVTKPSLLVAKFCAQTNFQTNFKKVNSSTIREIASAGIHLSFRGTPEGKTQWHGHADTNSFWFTDKSWENSWGNNQQKRVNTYIQDSIFLNANSTIDIELYTRVSNASLSWIWPAIKINIIELGE